MNEFPLDVVGVTDGKPVTLPLKPTIKQQTKQPQSSVAISVLNNALAKVTEVLEKAEQTLQLLQQNVAQVSGQRIGLSHQKTMLNELIATITAAENNQNEQSN